MICIIRYISIPISISISIPIYISIYVYTVYGTCNLNNIVHLMVVFIVSLAHKLDPAGVYFFIAAQ